MEIRESVLPEVSAKASLEFVNRLWKTDSRLVGLPSDEGDKLYLKVKLDNSDRVVHVRVHQHSLYQQGKKVRLEKQDALVFGRAVYRLMQ